MEVEREGTLAVSGYPNNTSPSSIVPIAGPGAAKRTRRDEELDRNESRLSEPSPSNHQVPLQQEATPQMAVEPSPINEPSASPAGVVDV